MSEKQTSVHSVDFDWSLALISVIIAVLGITFSRDESHLFVLFVLFCIVVLLLLVAAVKVYLLERRHRNLLRDHMDLLRFTARSEAQRSDSSSVTKCVVSNDSTSSQSSVSMAPSCPGIKQLAFSDESDSKLQQKGGVILTSDAIKRGQLVSAQREPSGLTLKKDEQVSKRTVTERLKKPFTSDEFRSAMKLTADFIIDYTENPTKYPVTTKLPPWSLANALPKQAPIMPEDYSKILKDVKDLIVPMMTQWQHPRFLAYFPHGRTHADIMAEAIQCAFCVVGFSYDSCPALTELEVVVTNWLATALGLPKGFMWNMQNVAGSTGAGFFLPSASDGVFSAIMASRDWKFERIHHLFEAGRMDHKVDRNAHLSAHHDIRHEICQRMIVYASKDAHSCLEKACKMAMVRCHPIQATAENEWGITGEQLEAAILEDLALGLVPFHVHLTLGTTSTSSMDHLDSVWPIARKYKLWLHVDAAYAGAAWILPEYRHWMKGIEHVTSLNINLNKFFLHVSPGTIMWVQDKDTFKRGFSINPPYLSPLKEQTIDLRDYGVQLTRTFRSLRTWFIMRSCGLEGIKRYITDHVNMAAAFEELLLKHPNVRPFSKRTLTLFCFYYYQPGFSDNQINTSTRRLAEYINQSHELYITRANVGKRDIIRVSVNYIENTMDHVREAVGILTNLIDSFKASGAGLLPMSASLSNVLIGRNARVGPSLVDLDLKATPPPQFGLKMKIDQWAESPSPITQEPAEEEIYRLPGSPVVTKPPASPST